MQSPKEKYVAFLRGINVGGHHKVQMADLRKELTALGFENSITILNSGNIIFDSTLVDLAEMENKIAVHLENHFGFPIPTIIRKWETIQTFIEDNPFKAYELTKDLRFYVSFLKKDKQSDLKLPWTSLDNSYKIIEKRNNNIFSILDLSMAKTPKAMNIVEKNFGKDTTTRNWNTIGRIEKKV